jgi:putative nucleotidyltransferase with HDIG domain
VAPAPEKKLLFVGATKPWFHEFEHALLELRPTWSAHHVVDPLQAQTSLSSAHWDALVTGPDIERSRDSLAETAQKFPRVFGFSLREELHHGSSAGPTSETMPNASSDPIESAAIVVRALSLHEWTLQPAIKSLLASIKKLPTLPRLHTQVIQELQSANGSLETVSQVVRQDPVMAAKFLQVINSAFFGLAYTIADPGEAVMLLGAVRTRALILMAGVFSQFDEVRCPGFSAEQVWKHSLQVARLAQGVTLVQTEDPKLAEMAFTAGLLHDIGKLVLAGNLPEMYSTAHKLQQLKRILESEAELAILGTTHAELGACLLGTWRLPLPIVEAIAWHHCPIISYDNHFSVLTAVHAANVFAHETGGANAGVGLPSRLDLMYLVRLGIAERRNCWREACGLAAREEEGTFEDKVRRRFEGKRN